MKPIESPRETPMAEHPALDACSDAAAVRRAQVKAEVNGQTITLVSATYHLPVTVAGVQIDCPITKGYNQDSQTDARGLEKDARLRLWPAGASWMPTPTVPYRPSS